MKGPPNIDDILNNIDGGSGSASDSINMDDGFNFSESDLDSEEALKLRKKKKNGKKEVFLNLPLLNSFVEVHRAP